MLTVSIPLGVALFGFGHASLAASAPQPVTLRTSAGRTVSGLLAVPAKLPAPAVLLIHGSGGLNGVIKSFAGDFARYGFLAVALDLFDGRTATNEAARSALRNEVNSNPAKAAETISAWIKWLEADPRTTGNVGIVGWSFGAPWALEAAIESPIGATVLYVGLTYPGATRLALLKGPVLVHLAERDYIDQGHLKMFENMMTEAGKPFEAYWYPGDHFFAFPTYPTYDKKSAETAWSRTVAFLRSNLAAR
jgi:carboxymethylenebutenolidase